LCLLLPAAAAAAAAAAVVQLFDFCYCTSLLSR
jgi:hypothetical protein